MRVPCPHLPLEERRLNATWMAPHRGRRDAAMCLAAKHCAQSLWQQGKPAQAILQLNRVLASRECWDQAAGEGNPYRALRWMLLQPRREGEFLGNPVRHFQHLATRMTGPDGELRSWRAWACFWISLSALDAGEHPVDEVQVRREGVVFPTLGEVEAGLVAMGGEIEWDSFLSAWEDADD